MDPARRQAIHEAMVRLSDGDRTAFDVLLDELWPVLLAFAQRGLASGPSSGSEAEDIAQEVFYKICARISDFDRNRDALSWAFGIASYELMTHRRRVQRRREVFDGGSIAGQTDGSPSQEQQLIAREIRLAFEQAVGALTQQDRIALGLGSDESEALGATLRKRKQRALERLRGIWRHIYGEP